MAASLSPRRKTNLKIMTAAVIAALVVVVISVSAQAAPNQQTLPGMFH